MDRWWKLINGNLRANKLRTVLAVLGVSLGIALVFAVQIANTSVEKSIANQTSKLFGNADVNVAVPLYSETTLSESDRKDIVSMGEIAETSAILQGYVKLDDEKEPLFVKGVEMATAKKVDGYDVVEGDWFTTSSENVIIISEQMADNNHLAPGDKLRVSHESETMELTIQGIVSAVGEGQDLANQGGLIPLEVSRDLLDVAKGYNEISVMLKDKDDTKSVVKKLEAEYGSLDVTDKSEVNKSMKASLDDLQSGLIFLTVISVILGGFIIYHTFSVIIAQRIKEIATFRALGATKQTVTSMMMSESLALGILGIMTGLLLGFGLGYVFLKVFAQAMGNKGMSYTVPINGVLFTIIIGVIVTIVASWFPVRMAAKKSPLEAFDQSHTQVNQPNEKLPIKRGVLGLLMLGTGIWGWFETIGISQQYYAMICLLFIFAGMMLLIPLVLTPLIQVAAKCLKWIFGLKGQLAALTLLRSKKRAVMSVTLVFITLTTILGITTLTGAVQKGWTEEFSKTAAYDLAVHPVGENFDDDFKDKLEKVAGTDQVTSINMFFIEQKELGRSLRINGVDMDKYYQMNNVITPDGFHDPDTDLMHTNEGITISEKVAADMDLDVGDTFTLKGKDDTIDLPIAAVYKEVDSGGYTITVPKQTVDDIYQPKGRNGFFITLDQDATAQEWKDDLQTFAWHDEVTIQTMEDTLNSVKAILAQMFMPFQAINIICVITAMLGVANTLLISVFERKKEIAMLRSIGSDRSQIKGLISMEGGVIGLLGIMIGYPCGLFIGYLLVFWWKQSMEASIPFHFPLLGLAIGIFATLIITILVSFMPASYAAKFDMVEHVK